MVHIMNNQTVWSFERMAQEILLETVELDQNFDDLKDQALINAKDQYTNYQEAVEAISQTGIGETLELVRWCLIRKETIIVSEQRVFKNFVLEPVAMANMALQSAIVDYADLVLEDTCRVDGEGCRVTTALTRNTLNKLA